MRLATVSVLAATIGLSGLAALSQAHASTISVTSVAVPYNEVVTIDAIKGPSLEVTAYTGQIQLTTSSGLLDVWCIDLYHDIGIGSVGNLDYQRTSLQSVTWSDLGASPLTTRQIAQIAGLIATGNSLMTFSPGSVLSAGIQMAIWQVEYPNSLSFAGVPPDTLGFNNASLGLTSGMTAGEVADRLVRDAEHLRGNAAALVSLTGTQSFATVPEPTTLALFGTGLLGLIRARRRPQAA